MTVNDKTPSDIAEIEDAQAGLRECIEATKELAERAEDLLQKCKARAGRENLAGDC
ncbi:hypothetical protein Q9Q95_18440 [Sphingomonas sp. DG1-23]|uniref:hypothetical protein n=1 Tax=Sphingomonas sp. DG1-23 TaxID=3068316 RepID=UPI00273ED24C|nr:hypothetical protein [Sphingomonas sp. DG1-23]MDP5280910.1 hypothetical protein [Sphingomonas sp. DG1-23]